MTSTEVHDENDTADNAFNTDKDLIERGQDLGALFNANGESFKLQNGQGVWVSYDDARSEPQAITAALGQNDIDLTINGVNITGTITTSSSIASERDNSLASYIAQIINAETGKTGVEAQITGGNQLTYVNTNKTGTETNMKNIDLVVNTGSGVGLTTTNVVTAFKYTYSASSAPSNPSVRDSVRTFTSTEDLRDAMQTDARLYTDYLGNGWDTVNEGSSNRNDGVEVVVNSQGQFEIRNPTGDAFNSDDGDITDSTAVHTLAEVTSTGVAGVQEQFTVAYTADAIGSTTLVFDGVTVTTGAGAQTNLQVAASVAAGAYPNWTATDNGDGTVTFVANVAGDIADTTDVIGAGTYGGSPTITTDIQGVTAVAAPGGVITEDVYFPVGTAWGTGASIPVVPSNTITLPTTSGVTLPAGTVYNIGGGNVTAPVGGSIIAAGSTFTNLVLPATSGVILPTGTIFSNSAELVLAGTNTKTSDDHDMFLSISAYSDSVNDVSQNTNFATTMGALQGSLTSGTAIRTSQNIYAANHASSIDVYDSLGTKHTVRFEFTKTGYTIDGGTEWSTLISVPEPGDINLGSYPENIVTGTISFTSDGSLASFNPTNLTYTANNGSTPNQNIELKFGSLGKFDGMTSFDNPSNTSGISQDGYPGGDLAGIRVDETGTLIGSFTNGRSFGLAQVSMARFTNNGGLESDGGNSFIQTSNSGDPIIGQAAVGGRGFIQASALEMSNVDLSRSLTQLIIVQRGFQANSKTITTSDQMLNTLLQLKQ